MKAPTRWTLGLFLTSFCLALAAIRLDRGLKWTQNTEDAKTLNVALRQSEAENASMFSEHSFDKDLFEAFAAEKGYSVNFQTTQSTQQSLNLIRSGKADAALGVANSDTETTFQRSKAYTKVQPLLACRSGVDVNKLNKNKLLSILLPEDYNLHSSVKVLKKLFPDALFLHQKNLTVGDAISIMHEKKIDCTLTQERLFKLYKLAYPRMKSPMLVGSSLPMSAFFAGKSWMLKNEFEAWLETASARVQLDSLNEKYFGFFEIFDPYEVEVFEKRIESRLRPYLRYFKEAELKHGIAWQILAAIAYQESHWNPYAKSFTGVRGMMMLTQVTAQEMGVANRIDPRKSILGGAAYLKKILNRLPHDLPEHEKLFLALASYNVGYGHVLDAQSLVKNEQESTNWHALKESLPLLSKKHIYKNLRHGKARGKEPVIYVQRIRKFHHLLSLAFSQEEALRSDNTWADNTRATGTNTKPLIN